MRYNNFGWSYPPGAEHDPNAPYNQTDMPETCPVCGEDNTDEDGNPVCDDPAFCSKECLEKYIRNQDAIVDYSNDEENT